MTHPRHVAAKGRVPEVDKCWSVALITLIVIFIAVALERSTGLLYIAFMEEFRVDRQAASWPQSLMICISGLSGLAVGLLQKRYSIRYIAVAGSVVGWIGIIASGFAPNIIWMSITMGVIHRIFRDRMGAYDNLYRFQGGLILFFGLLWWTIVYCEGRCPSFFPSMRPEETTKSKAVLEMSTHSGSQISPNAGNPSDHSAEFRVI